MMGLDAVNGHCLKPIAQIQLEPGEGSVVDSEGVFETAEKDGVVDSVKGRRKVKKCEK